MQKILKKAARKILATGLVVSMAVTGLCGVPFFGSRMDSVKAAVGADEEAGTYAVGGFASIKAEITKKDMEDAPLFGGGPKKARFDSAEAPASSSWNSPDNATYGCSDYAYSALGEDEKTAYDAILTATAGSDMKGTAADCFMASENMGSAGSSGYGKYYRVQAPGGVSDAAMQKAYHAVYEDHPEFYWFTSMYNNVAGGYLYVYVDEAYDTKAERDAIDQQIKAEREKYITAYDKSGSGTEFDKMVALHNKIIDETVYANDGSGKPEGAAWAHNIVGMFTGDHMKNSFQQVVCEGYAKAFQYILNTQGISNVFVIGDAQTGSSWGGHAWNLVEIENAWYYMDLTWDDAGETDYGYTYTGMPKSYFEMRHRKYTASSNVWMYDLPAGIDDTADLGRTYFGRYSAYATSSTDYDSFAGAAGASSPNGDLVILLDRDQSQNVLGAFGLSSATYIVAKEYDKIVLFLKDGAIPYKVSIPATELQTDPSEKTLDLKSGIESFDLTFRTGVSGSDDYVSVTASNAIVSLDKSTVPIKNGVATVKVTGRRDGSVTVTGKTVAGKAEASCNVAVAGAAPSQYVFKDVACTEQIGEDDLAAFANGAKVNGGQVGKTDVKVQTNKITGYTNMAVPTYTVGKKVKRGKIIVGITSSGGIPGLKNGKMVVDAAARKIASASIGSVKKQTCKKITVTAKSQPGTVYFHMLALGQGNTVVDSESFPIVVKAAPTAVTPLNYEAGNANAVKTASRAVMAGYGVHVYLDPTFKNVSKVKETIKEGITFRAVVAEKYLSCVKVEKISEFDFKVCGINLIKNKVTTVPVKFVCNENNKSATFKLKVSNPVTSAEISSLDGKSMAAKKDTSSASLAVGTARSDAKTTDAVSVIITNTYETGDVPQASKSKVYSGYLKDNVLTVKKLVSKSETATIYLLCNDKCRKDKKYFRLGTINADGVVEKTT